MMFKEGLAWLAEIRRKIAAGKRCRVTSVSARRRVRLDLERLEDRVTPSLLVNGDFETGDFTGWTQSGVTSFTSVVTATAHGGKFDAQLGPAGGDGFLAQTFTTTPGNSYTLNYWLQHDGGSVSDFSAIIDGTPIAASVLTDPVPAFAYTQYTFTFTAANPSTELKFGFREDPAYFHLDDVSVDEGTYVVPVVVRTNLTGTVANGVSTDHLVFNTPVDPASFTQSTPNDQYAITDPSSATINATTITATDPTNTQFDVTFPAQTTGGAYTLTVGPNITDPAANPMAAAFTSSFNVTIALGPNLLVNGDFETGDFTSWTQSGVLSFTNVNTNNPHTGTYSAELGPDTGEGFLAQSFSSTPGSMYVLDYWLQNNGGTPNSFHAMIDGVDIPGSVLSNAPGFVYTEYQFTFMATNPSTELKFGFLQQPAYWHLDDVSISLSTAPAPAPAPSPHGAGSGGPTTFVAPVDVLTAQAGLVNSPGWTLTPATPLAASGQTAHALSVDTGFSTNDGLANLPVKPQASATEVDPFSLGRLDEGQLWL